MLKNIYWAKNPTTPPLYVVCFLPLPYTPTQAHITVFRVPLNSRAPSNPTPTRETPSGSPTRAPPSGAMSFCHFTPPPRGSATPHKPTWFESGSGLGCGLNPVRIPHSNGIWCGCGVGTPFEFPIRMRCSLDVV